MLWNIRLRAVFVVAVTWAIAFGPQKCTAEEPLKSYKAAAIVYDPAWGDLDGNITRIAAAVDKAGQQGVKLAVLPEQATIGYIFDNFAMVRPYLDTVPGKTTNALAKVTARHHMYVAVGIAEVDPVTGLGYNTAALVGPNGYLGKYRKHGLNPQDQAWVTPGDGGFPVFDTDLGRMMMLICYDDTYWQYPRLAALHNVDVVAWLSSSDRVTPGTPAAQAKGDHSTVATVQHIAAFNGAPADTPFAPMAAAKLGQNWVVMSGWSDGKHVSAAVFGPEPVIATPPRVPPAGKNEIETQITIAWPGTWLNQSHLIDGQRPATTLPITLDSSSTCFQQWAKEPGWKYGC